MTTANGLSCPAPLNICTVYDPMTTTAPTATCFNSTNYVCLQPSAAYKGQFLCPVEANSLCGRACYKAGNYSCAVNDQNVYDSTLMQVFTAGGVQYSTGLLVKPNNTYAISFLPQNGTQVNYVIIHYQAVNIAGGVQLNQFANLTQTSSGAAYSISIQLPPGQSLKYSFSFQNTKGAQYDTGNPNFTPAAPANTTTPAAGNAVVPAAPVTSAPAFIATSAAATVPAAAADVVPATAAASSTSGHYNISGSVSIAGIDISGSGVAVQNADGSWTVTGSLTTPNLGPIAQTVLSDPTVVNSMPNVLAQSPASHVVSSGAAVVAGAAAVIAMAL